MEKVIFEVRRKTFFTRKLHWFWAEHSYIASSISPTQIQLSSKKIIYAGYLYPYGRRDYWHKYQGICALFFHFFSYNEISKTSIYVPSHKKPSGVPQLIYASRVSLKFLLNLLLLLVISSSTIIIIPVSL